MVQKKRLGEIALLQRGLTYSKGDEVPSSSKAVLRSNNIDLETHSLDLDELKYLREDFVIPEDKRVKKDSIFICMSNGSKQHVGKVAFIDRDMDYAFGGFMGLIVPAPSISAKYVFYACNSSSYRTFLSQIGNGIGITNLRFSDLEKFEIPVPSIEDQLRIVDELDLLTGIIDKKIAQLRDLDALAQSIFNEMFGDPYQNEKGWPLREWSDVLTIINGRSQKSVENPDGDYPIYGSGGIMGKADDWLCPEGCVIVGRKGNINKPILVLTKFWNVDTAFGLNPKREVLNPYYLYFFCLNYDFERLNKAVTIPSLTKSDLLKIKMPVPSIASQKSFAEKVMQIEKQKDLIKQSISDTSTLLAKEMDKYFGD